MPASRLFLFFIGGVILYMFVYKPVRLPLGLRLHNPGNIKELPGDRTQWVGERATDDHKIFEEFTSDFYGIRAMGRILASYRRRGISTVEQIINTWAPASDNNDTEAYIRSVERTAGISRHDIIEPDSALFPDLVAAIILQEQGVQPFSQHFINRALKAA